MEIEHRLEHLVLHLDQLHRLINAFFVRTGENRHHIAYKAHMAVDNKAVIRTRLRIGLTGLRVAAAVLVYVLHVKMASMPGTFIAAVLGGFDGADDGICMGRAQQLDDQAVLRDDVIHIDRLAGDQLHRVFFAERFVDGFHCTPSFCFFHARKLIMPRSWPS